MILRQLLEENSIILSHVIYFAPPKVRKLLGSAVSEGLKQWLTAIHQLAGLEHVPTAFDFLRSTEPDIMSRPDRLADAGEASALLQAYEAAPETGVVLALSGGMTEAAAFVNQHWKLFQKKTRSMVMLSDALPLQPDQKSQDGGNVAELTETFLEPDPKCVNNRFDPKACQLIYLRAQELGIPMVIISDYFATKLRVPKGLFHSLSTCGPLALSSCKDAENDLQEMWLQANLSLDDPNRTLARSGLTREFFLGLMCEDPSDPTLPGRDDTSSSIWNHIDNVFVETPLLLLAVTDREATAVAFRRPYGAQGTWCGSHGHWDQFVVPRHFSKENPRSPDNA